jgi:hypothetical protein
LTGFRLIPPFILIRDESEPKFPPANIQ